MPSPLTGNVFIYFNLLFKWHFQFSKYELLFFMFLAHPSQEWSVP